MQVLNRHHTSIIVLAIFMMLVFGGSAWAQEVAGGIMDDFISQTNSWWGVLREKALSIFKIVLTIDVCLFGFRMATGSNNVAEILKEFIAVLLFAGFIALVIVNYENWSKAVAINGLTSIIGDLTDENFSVDRPFVIARGIWDKTYEVSTSVELSQLPLVMIYMLAAGFLIVSMFFLCALMIMAKCEFYIVANVGVLLIGLGGSKIFKDYATNVMRYVLSIGIKIFVIQLLANIGLAMIDVNNLVIGGGDGPAVIVFAKLYVLVAKTLILIVLAKTLPDSCAGMISGAAAGGGNPMAAMAIGAATGGAARAMGMAKAGLGAASAVKNSYDVAKSQGAAGALGTAKGMGSAFLEARGAAKAAKLQETQSSTMSQLKSQASMARAQQAMRIGGSGGAVSSSSPAGISSPVQASAQATGTGFSSPSSGASNTPPIHNPLPTPPQTGAHTSSSMPSQNTAPLPPSPKDAAAAKSSSQPVDMRQP